MKVHLVDGTYELFRHYYAMPPAKDQHGREVAAVRGVVASLLGMISGGGATHVGVATDHVIESFRNDLWPGYKTGAGIDRVLLAQFHPGLTLNPKEYDMGILWTIIIGFVAGVIAKFIMPGDNEPSGFILTAILGIVGAFVATFLGQALGWYRPGEGAGLIGAVVGAVVVLVVYGMVAGRRRAI